MDFQTGILIALGVVVVFFVGQRFLIMRNVVEITPQEAQEKVKAGAIFIDVRQPEEFKGGHAAKSKLLPLGQLSQRLNEIPKGKPVVIICASGNRSASAASQLTKMGYENVFSVRGGMGAWRAATLPINK